MSPDDTGDGPRPLPVEAYPAPVLEYGLSDGEPVVRTVNDSFRSELGFDPRDVTVTDLIDQVGATPLDREEAIVSRIVRGNGFDIEVAVDDSRAGRDTPSNRYRATVIPDPEGPTGHIVFRRDSTLGTTDQSELGVDHVASVVSHDLRNPLEVAKTRLRAGRETGDEEHFDHVAQAHDRMEQIIQDVLTLARGEDAIDPSEAVDLTETAEAAWDSVETNGATLTIDSRLPTAVVDADRTRRLFENLFRNAVEHAFRTDGYAPVDEAVVESSTDVETAHTADDRGDPAPSIRVGSIDSGTESGFYVADDGPGIPVDQRDAVFEPGYSTHDHGTGLGLAIVQQIAEAHGWSVDITSASGSGTRVDVTEL